MERSKKKRFIEGVSHFGIEKIDETLVKWGSERIRAYSGDFSRDEIGKLRFLLPVEGIGLYVGKDAINKRTGVHEYRLSLDAVSVWGDKIVKNIIDIDEAQEDIWFTGADVDLTEEQVGELNGFVVVRSKKDGDFIGVGKLGLGNVLYSFMPKERRRKVNVIT